ncbi:MAG: hypothetical protein RJB58_1473, partial [Pseudomonadota bacterium]
MLQCSNCKAGRGFLTILRNFYFGNRFPEPRASVRRYQNIGYFAGVQDLRNLLSVAAKLHRLADDTPYPDDKHLYLTAAAVLEARGERMASHLPDE